MLVYSSDKHTFLDDVAHNVISDRILEAFQRRGFGSVSPNERRSWDESLNRMKTVLEDPAIPGDAGIAVEYRIPQTAKRVDIIVTGADRDRRETCVIVELKQWEKVEATDKDAIVRTVIAGGPRETTHPSYQAWSYAALLQDFNATVQEEDVGLYPCAYLHNCKDASTIRAASYQTHVASAPVFLGHEMNDLRQFIRRYVHYGDRDRILYRIEQGRIRPSKDLANSLAGLLQGNREFLMIDDQKLAYEAALEVAELGQANKNKQVLVIEGGPGTGKSVVAINLLVELTRRYQTAQYVTPNQAPRQVYESRLTGTMTKTRFSNLFKGSGSYDGAGHDELDVLVVDEAHRLLERSQFQRSGTHQVRDIIGAAKTAIFFIDEAQQVKWKDLGSRAEIEQWAAAQGATVSRATLQSQFRCNGSDGYLAWLTNVLQLAGTAQEDLEGLDYQISVIDSPNELRDQIRALDRAGHRARLVAGYCWNWSSKDDPRAWDINFPEHSFHMQWNLSNDEGRYLEKAHSVDQVGCIHTVQGLEMDYVGVIVGPDLIVRDGEVITQPSERAKTDRSLDGYKKDRRSSPADAEERVDRLIKNTYRVLMSRGLKGCFIYCTDPETHEYFRDKVAIAIGADVQADQGAVAEPSSAYPSDADPTTEPDSTPRIISAEEAYRHENTVPLIDLKAAAGGFAEGIATHQQLSDAPQWVILPDLYRARDDLFAVRVFGESMNRRIPNGALCLFKALPGGSRNGQVVLVHHHDIQDPDIGGGLTVKVYRSEKHEDPTGEWYHTRITLACDTLTPGYQDIVLDDDQMESLQVIGHFKGTICSD